MGRKLLGTALVLFLLSVVFLIARDNLSSGDWHSKSDQEVSPDEADAQTSVAGKEATGSESQD